MSSLICQKFENKLEDLIATRRWVNTKADVARYCNVQPQTVRYWCETETLTQQRIKQLEELFNLQSGDLFLSWSDFKETVIKRRPTDSNPWKRLLVEADPPLHPGNLSDGRATCHTLNGYGGKRMIPEYEPDEDEMETYRRGERVYMRLELPKALHWAKQMVVLGEGGKIVNCVCPSDFCPDNDVNGETLTLPKDINGTVSKTTGDGLQSLVTVITAQPLPDNLCQRLRNEASKLSEETLQKLAARSRADRIGCGMCIGGFIRFCKRWLTKFTAN